MFVVPCCLLDTSWSYFILFVFATDDGGMPKRAVQDNKTNKLIKVYLIDLWIESYVDWSVFEKGYTIQQDAN
jgi:hypothetical protein